ncbi:hypothetical protein ACFE04_006756 [Oxalis oulophora]
MEKQILLVLGMIFLVVGSGRVGAITCPEAGSDLLPCVPYLTIGLGKPSSKCCDGVQKLNSAANTPEARKEVCNCFLQAIKSFPINYDRANAIPKKCGVTLPFTISPNIDCNTIA